MPTVAQRYQAAIEYVRRAVVTVESRGILYAAIPTIGLVEWQAGKTKTTEPRAELARLEARWNQAASDTDRAIIARDSELLADRVEENLPGAPQDRARTNLFNGETPSSAPATSYVQDVDRQARAVSNAVQNKATDLWQWLSDKSTSVEREASSFGKWLLVGGGIVLAWKGVDYLRARQEGNQIERALNTSLARAAGSRNARPRAGYYVRSPDSDLYYRVVRDNGGRQVLLAPLTDDARDAISDREVYEVTLPDGSGGEGYSDDIAHYERVSKLPRWVLQ